VSTRAAAGPSARSGHRAAAAPGSPQATQRRIDERMIDERMIDWTSDPTDHPIIVHGIIDSPAP
jgi:hypothetical protein